MALSLVVVSGPKAGGRVRLQPGSWALVADESGPQLAPATAAGTRAAAVFDLADDQLGIAPLSPGMAVNGVPLTGRQVLCPNDRIELPGLVLQVRADVPAPVEAVGVALPPPDPPAWRHALRAALLLAAVAMVVVLVRVVPRRAATPLDELPPEVRHRVQRSTVWVQVQLDGGEGEGSGYVPKAGYVVTNAHVVLQGRSVEVTFHSGERDHREAPAKVLKTGEPGTSRDFALLQVDTGDTPALPSADLDKLQPGDALAAFGFPMGSAVSTSSHGPQVSLRAGRLTALRRDDSAKVVYVESDIAGEVGNSGGPMVTKDGKVVGLGTMAVGPHLKTFVAAPINLLHEFAPAAVPKP
ncbi:MAG: trypsin-like peptidase domain-containing protein [Armatimonadetes bacterium]|nr:trypsin-like peptidase domain-containing protein [Armatimonadota bacterium]